MFRTTLSRRASEFLGVALFGMALVWLISLATYDPADNAGGFFFYSTGDQAPPANFVGRVGAFLAELSFQVFGFASYLAPTVLVVLGWHFFWCRPIDAAYTKVVGLMLLFGCAASFLSLAFESLQSSGKPFQAGGYLGDWLAALLAEYLNRTGSIILILTVLFLSIILSTQFSFGRLFSNVAQSIARWAAGGGITFRQWWAQRRRERQRQEVIQKHLDRTGASTARTEILAKSQSLTPSGSVQTRKTKSEPAGDTSIGGMPPVRPSQLQPLPLPELAIKSPSERRKGAFTLPPVSLLDSPKEVQKVDERELRKKAKLLQEKCREFSVEGEVKQIQPGPVVTTFEFKPDVGVKYSKITRLADDLCLAMQAESVLIERLPGKSTVGIQIPNQIREQISLRDLLESELYQRSASRLTLALGKTIHGDPLVNDLAEMPHLLIAGSTGTGKSVSLNAMLTSILMRATPEDVRLILIDPKRLELGMYEGIPHLLTPVVVDPKQAANALRWAVREMEERYKKLATEGVRNIEQYNRNVQLQVEERAQSGKPNLDDEPLPKSLPFIVLAIDELADLMLVASKEVEESIARLAQMARAVGIHLILATQRPSVDVITGLIKANMPSRIAFRASSKVDSRTILDANGAEQLLGKGDMLFLPPSSSRCVRVHGPYVSEQETARLASFLRKQGKPDYDERITADEKTADVVTFQQDDLYEQAARIIVSNGQASISYLQRRLRIGFSRAARLVDMMEADGLVSTGAAGKPREVLVKPDYFDEVDLQSR